MIWPPSFIAHIMRAERALDAGIRMKYVPIVKGETMEEHNHIFDTTDCGFCPRPLNCGSECEGYGASHCGRNRMPDTSRAERAESELGRQRGQNKRLDDIIQKLTERLDAGDRTLLCQFYDSLVRRLDFGPHLPDDYIAVDAFMKERTP